MSFAWKDLKRWCVSTATKILNVCFCLINILKCLLQCSNWREGRGAIWLPWPAKCNLPTNRFFVRCRHFACFGVFSDYKTFPTTKAFGKTFPTTKALRKTFSTTKENLPDYKGKPSRLCFWGKPSRLCFTSFTVFSGRIAVLQPT